jgi:DNA-binding sugar fermentation-stimulating protein
LYGEIPDEFVNKVKTTTPSLERINKHINSFVSNLKENDRAIILSVFQYDAPPFRPPINEPIYSSFIEDLNTAKTKGLENWQLNLKISEKYVEILKSL